MLLTRQFLCSREAIYYRFSCIMYYVAVFKSALKDNLSFVNVPFVICYELIVSQSGISDTSISTISLQWHPISVTASEITDHWTICSMACWQQRGHECSELAFCFGCYTDGFPMQRDSNVENISVPWRHHVLIIYSQHQAPLLISTGGGWGCEVSSGGHHRQRGRTTTGSALDGAVLDFTQTLAYLVYNMSRSQLYLGFGHLGWLSSFFGQ